MKKHGELMNNKLVGIFVVYGLLFIPMIADPVFSKTISVLEEGIDNYNRENYVEAIDLLKEARKQNPDSTLAAFYLGMAYKQTFDYQNAFRHLEDAVTGTPKIKDAVVELIFTAERLNRLEVAEKWIGTAESENISPADVAFLKGMVLRNRGRIDAAIESFRHAGRLNPSISQAADYEIAVCHMKEKNLKAASDNFKTVITKNPQSDLAVYARQFLDAVEKRMELEKPFNLRITLLGQYDTNVVLKPTSGSIAEDVTDEAGFGMLGSLWADYTPVFEGPFLFSASYGVSGNFHRKHSTTHDTITNSVQLVPGFRFGGASLNLSAGYSYSLLRGTSYKSYTDELNAGLLGRKMVTNTQILEIYGGFLRKEYFQPPSGPAEDRDAQGADAYLSWIWLFSEKAFFNLRAEFIDENTDGVNWENMGWKMSANAAIPLLFRARLQLGGEVFYQEYDNVHTELNIEREDETHYLYAGLTWEFYTNIHAVAQYAWTRCHSNAKIYDYGRDVFSLGLEYRF